MATALAFSTPALGAAKPETKASQRKAKAKTKAAKATEEDQSFQERFAALTKAQKLPAILVKMGPKDDPFELPATGGEGTVLVASGRRGIYTPPLLSSEDILAVVNEQMGTIRKCFKAQLASDPEWNDNVILDLSVKKTGRVSEVSLAPGRVERAELGRCLLAEVPKWKFPQFTGELEDGVVQEVVNASFPFSFSVR